MWGVTDRCLFDQTLLSVANGPGFSFTFNSNTAVFFWPSCSGILMNMSDWNTRIFWRRVHGHFPFIQGQGSVLNLLFYIIGLHHIRFSQSTYLTSNLKWSTIHFNALSSDRTRLTLPYFQSSSPFSLFLLLADQTGGIHNPGNILQNRVSQAEQCNLSFLSFLTMKLTFNRPIISGTDHHCSLVIWSNPGYWEALFVDLISWFCG